MLAQDDAPSRAFKEDIARLHERLSKETLRNKGRVVSFEECYFGVSKVIRDGGVHNGLTYLVERGCGHVTGKEVYCEVQTRSGAASFTFKQPQHDVAEL